MPTISPIIRFGLFQYDSIAGVVFLAIGFILARQFKETKTAEIHSSTEKFAVKTSDEEENETEAYDGDAAESK